MTQQPVSKDHGSNVPAAGMRGGLGRTLLTAFLLLSIVPLSIISFVASTQGRHNLQQELEEKLVTVADLTESQIHSWATHQELILSLLCDSLQAEPRDGNPAASDPDSTLSSRSYAATYLYREVTEIQAENPAFMALLVLDLQGQVLAAYPSISDNHRFPDLLQHEDRLLEADSTLVHALASSSSQIKSPALVLAQPVAESDLTLVALLDPYSLIQTVSTSPLWDESGEILLVLPSGQTLKLGPVTADTDLEDTSPPPLNTARSEGTNVIQAGGQTVKRHSMAIEAALAGQSGTASYENYQGVMVIGTYRWLSNLNAALLVEQRQDIALCSSDNLAIVLIGATLAVALLTALIAAAVTRRITLPIVQLTATAVQIAAGDLNQKVPTTRHDEIGILARAFNVMTSKLRVLYENLEQKVRERTQQLREANAEIRYRAMQLTVSAEVARVVTSILDREALLARVVELIRDCFQVYFVAVFFIDESDQWAILQEGSGGLGKKLKDKNYRVDLSQDSLISQVANSLESRVCKGSFLEDCTDRTVFPHTRAELSVPLRIGQRRVGVLDVHSTHEDAFEGDETMVLETLAGQIAVAIENARVYQLEHEAVEQLRELDESQRRFLSSMSRELRMPLNNIIGFSRVILKGIDGPITDIQREDLNAIYDSGQQLLALINDILDVAQIEAGTMELSMRLVNLGEIAHSLIPTTHALLEGRPIQLRHEIAADLPQIYADPLRLRQVLVKLLSNAAKFTQEGEIAFRVWPNDKHVVVSISDTGIGIPEKYREKMFDLFHQVPKTGANTQGTGLGLKFSKEIIEMHGGTICFKSEEGKGTTFTIALPIAEQKDDGQ